MWLAISTILQKKKSLLRKGTGSHIHCKCGKISEAVQDVVELLLQTTNMKCCLAHQIVVIPRTLNHF